MRQINCYIPIKLRITGRLSDAQLDQLGEDLVRALAARMAFAERTLAAHGITSRADAWRGELTTGPFESARWSPETETYNIPSYKAGGKRIVVPLKEPKRQPIALMDEIRKAVEKKVMERELDERYIMWRGVEGWQNELVDFALNQLVAKWGLPPEPVLEGIKEEIKEKIVDPLIGKRLRKFFLSEVDEALSPEPEVEYAALPPEVKEMVAGGVTGWLEIRDVIAAQLSPVMQNNLLRYFSMAPDGKMTKIKIWPDKDEALVHEDLLPALRSLAKRLAELEPSLKEKYRDFWKQRSNIGLQIRRIANSNKASPHAWGKAIDVAGSFNPHLTDPRILEILSLVGEIDAMDKAFAKRKRLIAEHWRAKGERKETSKEFKEFLEKGKKRHEEWFTAQEKFKRGFPPVSGDPQLVFGKIIPLVKEKLVTLGHEKESAEGYLEQAKSRRVALKEQIGISKSRRTDLKAAELEVRRAEAYYKNIKKQYDWYDKLTNDLESDPKLQFGKEKDIRKQVTNPGLESLRRQGFLSIPWEVVELFLEHGFYWGGFWAHPDFMHFEWAGKVSGEI